MYESQELFHQDKLRFYKNDFEIVLNNEIFVFLGEEQKKVLETELHVLKEKLVPTESALVEAASKLKKLQVKNLKY